MNSGISEKLFQLKKNWIPETYLTHKLRTFSNSNVFEPLFNSFYEKDWSLQYYETFLISLQTEQISAPDFTNRYLNGFI